MVLKGEVYIGLIPATISPINKVNVVNCLLFQRDTIGDCGRVGYMSHKDFMQ